MEEEARPEGVTLTRRSGRVTKPSEKARVYQQQRINAMWEKLKKNSNTQKRSKMRSEIKAMKAAQKKATAEVAKYSKLYKGVAHKKLITMKKLAGLRRDYSKSQSIVQRMMTRHKKARNNQTKRHRMGVPPASPALPSPALPSPPLPTPPRPPPARLSAVLEAKSENKNMNNLAKLMSKTKL